MQFVGKFDLSGPVEALSILSAKNDRALGLPGLSCRTFVCAELLGDSTGDVLRSLQWRPWSGMYWTSEYQRTHTGGLQLTRNSVQLHTKCLVLPLVFCSPLSRFPTLVIVEILSVLFEACRATGEIRRLARLWIFGDLPKTDVEKIFFHAFEPSW
jgi:hypothetical protein